MSTPHDHSRLWDLACERVVRGLSPHEEAEFVSMRSELTEEEMHELESTVAAIDLAISSPRPIHIPVSIRAKIESQASELLRSELEPSSLSEPQGKLSRPTTKLGGRNIGLLARLAVAASILIAAVLWFGTSFRELTPSQLRNRVLGDASAVRATWSPGGHASGAQAAGEVLWSNRLQQGVMVFRGLPSNDSRTKQYQLWIFDANQDERYPIDGGVFDIPSGATEVIVPIDAKLRVQRPTMFAITLEKAGGVVVSSREELPLLAKVEVPAG